MEQVDVRDSSPSRLHLDPATMSASDFPPKKLVRQLDFTASCGASTGVVLPQPPQLRPKQPHHHQRPKIQSPVPSHPMLLMSVSPQAPHTSMRILKPESPKSRVRPNAEVKEGTPKKQKQCNCKHSRCLKLYCECFASGVYCDGCNCANCHNNAEYEAARREAVEATLERNPNAFRPKIASSPHGGQDSREESREGLILAKHNKGCNCKKSGCLKKYCECFQAGILCSDNCKCLDCKNFEGSEERQALFHGDNTNSFAYIQQAANAAITGAIGSSGFGSPPISKKRKNHDIIFGQASKDSSVPRASLCQQNNHIKASATFSSSALVPTLRGGMNGSSAPSRLTYRSLLADIVQPNDVRELCSVLVVLSGEAGRTLRGKSDDVEKRKEEQGEASNVPVVSRCTGTPEEAGSSGGKEREMDGGSGNCSPEGHVVNGRAMSPGTLALMCDEQETMFMPTASPGDFMRNGSGASLQPLCSKANTEVYAEQERIVLTRFRDCLNRLITFGEIKEAKHSSLAKSDGLCHVDPPCEASRKSEQVNGVSKPGFLPTNMYSGTPSLCPKVEGVAENGDVGR